MSPTLAERATCQPQLFAERPRRVELLQLPWPATSPHGEQIIVNVWRNHAFEGIAPLVQLYAGVHGMSVQCRVSAYDDSLTFDEHRAADAELLWIDSRRYLDAGPALEWLCWLTGRIHELRRRSSAPIVVATWLPGDLDDGWVHALESNPGVYVADLARRCEEEQIPLLDLRTERISGTPVSPQAMVHLARAIACHWLPGVLRPSIKAVALDLDHTLHRGVIGEDGPAGVELTDAHRGLQQYLLALKARGTFLALVSRNEPSDVETLFSLREDYPLRWSDFSVTEISWGDKATAIERVATSLRVAPDAILFVDDNLGELTQVTGRLPALPVVHANENARVTQQAIHFYPGVWRWRTSAEDGVRVRDLAANAERERVAHQVETPSEYFASLRMSLTIEHDRVEQLSRLAELSGKTNQFNLCLGRCDTVELAANMADPTCHVTSIHLADRLSDSGIIGLVAAKRTGKVLTVRELCISCRALGRQLEDVMIAGALRSMPLWKGVEQVHFQVRRSTRNRPAREWLSRLLADASVLDEGVWPVASTRLESVTVPAGLTLVHHSQPT